MWTKAFWKGAGERAVKTFLQTFVAVAITGVGAEAIGATAGLLDIAWLDAASVALVATILSVGTSVGNADFTAGYDQRVKVRFSEKDVANIARAGRRALTD